MPRQRVLFFTLSTAETEAANSQLTASATWQPYYLVTLNEANGCLRQQSEPLADHAINNTLGQVTHQPIL
jgi:hypothetical protein